MKTTRLLYLLFFLSGVAGLGYEITWTRMFAIGLGHEMPSMLAVVAAFFGGIAAGAWIMDGVVSRSRSPARWYLLFELIIGIWAMTTVLVIPKLNELIPSLIGVEPSPVVHWFWAMLIPFVVLFPATFAMGATFPAMERMLSRQAQQGRVIGGVYSVNTAGAMAGTLLSTYLLLPGLGFSSSLFLLAVVNFTCVLIAFTGPVKSEKNQQVAPVPGVDSTKNPRLWATLFATGSLGIGYQVLGIRVMAQVLENTVYTFASALSAYLLATAVGAFLYQRYLTKHSFSTVLTWLLHLLSIACLFGILLLHFSHPIYLFFAGMLGDGVFGSVGAELIMALVIFLLPATLMGALFSHLAQAAKTQTGGIGHAFGVNTLGSALAPAVFAIMLLPAIGAKWSIVIVALGYLLLLPALPLKPLQLAMVVGSLLLAALLPASLNLVTVPPGGKLLDYKEGVLASVSVVQQADGERLLKVNNRFAMGSSAGIFPESRMAHLPLLLHPQPETALFLGVGTGITAKAAASHSGIDITAVELVPEVLDFVDYFDPGWSELAAAPNYRVADARRFVRAVPDRYDVVVADLFHAARDGAGMLYTREHFEAINLRLNSGGLFVQWLPLHQLDLESLRLIVKTFIAVFPESMAVMAHYNIETPLLGLVGSSKPFKFNNSWIRDRVKDRQTAKLLQRAAIRTNVDIFGSLIGSREDLERFSVNSLTNTDNHPRVMFQAPYFAYRKDEASYLRLAAILKQWQPRPGDYFDTTESDTSVGRLEDYIAARNLFLMGLIELKKNRVTAAIDLLLKSSITSREFRTSRVLLMQIARDLDKSRPEVSKNILEQLRG